MMKWRYRNTFITNLQTREYWGHISGISAGTVAQPNMKIRYLLDFSFMLPPLPEQRVIAATLSAKKDTQYAFAICLDDKAIGSIGVFRGDNVHRYTAEMGYYIAEPHWGKGVTTEAVRQMCVYIFENTDIIRIFAEPYAYNDASCRVLEKAGFQFEGVLRRNAVKNGHTVDMKMYAIIRDERKTNT